MSEFWIVVPSYIKTPPPLLPLPFVTVTASTTAPTAFRSRQYVASLPSISTVWYPFKLVSVTALFTLIAVVSTYTPLLISTVSPPDAALIAFWIECAAVPHVLYGRTFPPSGDTYTVAAKEVPAANSTMIINRVSVFILNSLSARPLASRPHAIN